jgi:GxxExxY protein
MPIQDPLTGLIIGSCFRVANELGPGFLEKVYENALAHDSHSAHEPANIFVILLLKFKTFRSFPVFP